MQTGWIISIVALWIVVLFETGLLLLLLRSLGELKQKGWVSPETRYKSPDDDGLPIGEQAPSFTATRYDGSIVELKQLHCRSILAFVLPGCPACREAIQVLNTVVQSERKLEVVVIGGLDRNVNYAYEIECDAYMPILTPSTSLIAKESYRIQGFPFFFMLSEEGRILAKGVVNNNEHLQELLNAAFVDATVGG